MEAKEVLRQWLAGTGNKRIAARVGLDVKTVRRLVSLRFLERASHVIIVGPVGVGKTFLAHALGHIACRHGRSVLALRADKMLKTLEHARLDNSYEAELRKLLAPDLLVVDDFALDSMDAVESRDAHEIITERHRSGSMVFTSNRGPDEWLAMFADPMRAQSAIDRLTVDAYDLVSHRGRVVSATGQAERVPTTVARSPCRSRGARRHLGALDRRSNEMKIDPLALPGQAVLPPADVGDWTTVARP